MVYSAFIALVAAVTLQPAAPSPAAQGRDLEQCLTCHGDRDLSVSLPSGETRSLFVDAHAFAGSVHGGKLGCVDCHADMQELPHQTRSFRTRREFTIAYYEQCKRCHFANYSKTLDSVHYASLARGDRNAPVCVDCHGAHDVTRPGKPRARISQTCARCHEGVSRTYANSVHGRALFEEKNADVPTCTDCHRSHDITGPRVSEWRLKTPELCASCHANGRMMSPYGLSTAVMQTYLADFHGMTASLHRSEGKRTDPQVLTALCVDCHGVHDISRTKGSASAVIKANLLKTCQKCHPGATKNFSDAWLSHYQPSLSRTPLIYIVRVGYAFLIPFMIGGLVLQILLHLWRVVVNR
ncbi:MAG: cytochrome c3 family protein [Acidobacteria bacterium]|nr:cytochrome c3 family protein [Acidobacteriota bacterium]